MADKARVHGESGAYTGDSICILLYRCLQSMHPKLGILWTSDTLPVTKMLSIRSLIKSENNSRHRHDYKRTGKLILVVHLT